MKTISSFVLKSLVAAFALWALPANAGAWEPSDQNLDAAVKSGDFAGYLTNVTVWLNQKAQGSGAAKPTEAALKTLLKDSAFAKALDQRQLIVKTGADKLAAFSKADPANPAFLAWLLKNTSVMDLYLEGVVPIGLAAREQNAYALSMAPLKIWQNILAADPDAKDGLYLRLAIATAIAPPGNSGPGAGQAKTQDDPLSRYLHFKTAHKNKELFPSFDHLTVWELTKVVCSNASNDDLAWARMAINTWRPDLRADELVVNSTSEVWRRNSPISYDNSFKNVLSGGGKCGPRSSWSVMVCQAFGIPAIGVGQPAHACVAYKTAYPMTEPQPGSAWKVGYGRGWQVSKLEGMSGLEFLAGVEDRAHLAEFSLVEHLRWLAAALASPEQAAAIMDVAHAIQKAAPTAKTDVTASANASEAEKELVPEAKAAKAALAGPIKVTSSVTRFEAAAFSQMSGIRVLDSVTGGKQVNFQKSVPDSWVEYTLDVPTAGTYRLEAKVAAANVEQVFNVKAGNDEAVTMQVPYTTGLWETAPAIEIKLAAGLQTLRVSAPSQRGVAVKWFELKAK